jgi:L-idonate 5-dehydrogenase
MRPARPCHKCSFCIKEQYSYCEAMEHLGSAARLPHTAGLFADKALIHEDQAKVVRKVSSEAAAFAEPLSVAYNGVRSAGEIIGRNVLVMGAGPIGALSAAAAKVLGAAMVAAVDVRQLPLDICRRMGVEYVVNSGENPDQIARWKEKKGFFDVMIEASGNGAAVAEGMAMVKPWGTVSQVGMFALDKGPTEFGPFTTKSITWRGVFRFYDEFSPAVDALEQGFINPLPLLSASYPAAQCVDAIKEAMSPRTAKVQLVFAEK